MGSIELFPRAAGAGAAAQAWRVSPLGDGTVRVREARFGDYAAIRMLQRQACPCMAPATLRQWESRIHGFAAGQMVAVREGQVVGAASALMLHWDDRGAEPTWSRLTGDGGFTTHEPAGRTLYAAQLLVDVGSRGYGIGRALLQAQRMLCRRLNLRRMVATVRLQHLAGMNGALTAEDYAMRVIWGDHNDAQWRFFMSQGFQYCGILRGFQPEDEASSGHAALLAWLNPLYAPPSPPASERDDRARKCA